MTFSVLHPLSSALYAFLDQWVPKLQTNSDPIETASLNFYNPILIFTGIVLTLLPENICSLSQNLVKFNIAFRNTTVGSDCSSTNNLRG